MRSGGVHHVDLVVSSIERSLPFYRDLLGPLGWHVLREVEGERGETIWYLGGRGTSIGLREAQSEGDADRYAVGLHHLAFEAWSRGRGGRYLVHRRRCYDFYARAAASKRCFAYSTGTSVGYLRVRHARQRSDSGRRVASTRPSWERYASEVAPMCARTSSTVRPAA